MPRRRMAVFLTVVLTVWTAMHAYVLWRASSVPFVERHVPRWLLLGAGGFLWASFILGRLADRHGPSFLALPLEVVGANWLGVLFLAFACLLAADLATGFGFLLPDRAPGIRGWALAAAGLLSAVGFVQALRPPAVTEHEVRLAGLPAERDGTVLAVASDLHVGTLPGEGWLAARVEQIRGLRPDVVLFCGDVLEGDGGRAAWVAPILRRLSPPLGSWAVTGNHEFYGGLEECVRTLEEGGFTVLRDRAAEAGPGLVLAGVDDLTARRQFARDGEPVARALAGRPPGATILLSHTPWQAGRAAAAGAGLMISGHTHGGQIWPFGYVVRRTYPLLEGRHEVDGMTVLVCRGTGTWGPRMRLWGRGEILRVTLRAE